MKPMTPKQLRFVIEYLKDSNATQACIRAGYSLKFADSMGPRLIRKSQVLREIRKRLAKVAYRTEVSLEKVVKEYMKTFAVWDDNSVTLRDSGELDPNDSAAVAEVTAKVSLFGMAVSIKLHDKVAALDALSKHLGLFREGPLDTVEALLDSMPRELSSWIRAEMAKVIHRNGENTDG
jgi:phage terminase small subunit